MSGLNKTLAGLTAAMAMGGTFAQADPYTAAANEDMPASESLVMTLSQQSVVFTPQVVSGAKEYLKQNVSEVKNNVISVTQYAEQVSQNLLGASDTPSQKLPLKTAQACLTIYAAALWENAGALTKDIQGVEKQLKGQAVQVMRAHESGEFAGLGRNIMASMGVALVKMDVKANLADAQLLTSKACVDMIKGLANKDVTQQAAAQKAGQEGLYLIENYKNPFSFSAEEVAYFQQNVPALKSIGNLPKDKRDKAIENYIMTTDACARAESYMTAFEKANPEAGKKVEKPVRMSLTSLEATRETPSNSNSTIKVFNTFKNTRA